VVILLGASKKNYHLNTLHAGANHALLASRSEVWFLMGPKIAKNIRKRCEQCAHYDRKPISVPEATLPIERLTPCYTFQINALDFARQIYNIAASAKDEPKKIKKNKICDCPYMYGNTLG